MFVIIHEHFIISIILSLIHYMQFLHNALLLLHMHIEIYYIIGNIFWAWKK